MSAYNPRHLGFLEAKPGGTPMRAYENQYQSGDYVVFADKPGYALRETFATANYAQIFADKLCTDGWRSVRMGVAS